MSWISHRWSTSWRAFWRREPLLSFAIAGGISFFILAPYLPWGRETIRIDARTAAAIVERRAIAEGRELSEQERTDAIDDFVREEILVREAYRNGWHLQNGGVRQRLLLAMRTALSEDLPQASPAQLRAYFQTNADRYRVPETRTLSHVFFATGSPHASGDAARILDALEAGSDFRGMGDRFWLGATMVRQTRGQLQGALGPGFADAVFALELASWAGPIESNRGIHFVRVEDQHPPELPVFEAVRRFVEVDWEMERRREIQDRKLARIRARYTVSEP